MDRGLADSRGEESAPKKDWRTIQEEHAVAYFAADLVMENPGDYTLDEKRDIIERMQASTAEVDEKIRGEFRTMPPESQGLMLNLLEDSPEGREWWEHLLLGLDDLPDAPPEG